MPSNPLLELLEPRALFDATVTVGVPTVVNVSHEAGQQSEGTVAIDPTNPLRVFAASNESGVSLLGATSDDGGITWAPAQFAGATDLLPQACCDPSAAWDEFGNLFFAYLAVDTGSVVVLASADAGRSFRQVASFGGENDQPTVAVGAGSVWVAFNQDGVGPVAHGAAVTGPGQIGSFGKPRRIDRRGGAGGGGGAADAGGELSNVGDIAIGPGGQVLMTYQTARHEGPSDVFARLDPDGLGPRPFGPAVHVTSTNVGDFDHVPPQNQRTIDAEVDLAYDLSGGVSGGRVYLAYTDETPDESGNTDVLSRFSDDDGASWSAPQKLNDDATPYAQILARIEVDPATGVLGAAWHDARNDTGTGGAAGPTPATPGLGGTDADANDETQFYAAVALPTAAGLAVQPNVQINGGFSAAAASHNANEYGDYIGLSFRGGMLSPVWADNSNSTGDNPDGFHGPFDLYAARVPVTVSDPAPPPQRRLVGQTGDVGSKTLVFSDADGTVVTVSLRGGGTASAFQESDRVNLVLRGTTARSSLRVTTRGGDGRVTLGDVTAAGGPLGSVNAPAADLLGSFAVAGPVSRLTLGDVSGGTVAAAGPIARATVSSLSRAKFLSGATPPTPTRGATFGPGFIGRLTVRGSVADSIVGAGLDPVNGQFLDADDRVIGGPASVIQSIVVKGGVDEATRFVAGAFKTARLPGRVDPATDPKFVRL
jgi:hypothetical protein